MNICGRCDEVVSLCSCGPLPTREQCIEAMARAVFGKSYETGHPMCEGFRLDAEKAYDALVNLGALKTEE